MWAVILWHLAKTEKVNYEQKTFSVSVGWTVDELIHGDRQHLYYQVRKVQTLLLRQPNDHSIRQYSSQINGQMRTTGEPNNPRPSPKCWCTTAPGFAKICSMHMVIYTPGRAGVRLQRAEEGELCRGCRHRKLYCNAGDSGDTAAQSFAVRIISPQNYLRQWSTFQCAHPDPSWGKSTPAFICSSCLDVLKKKNYPSLHHSGRVSQ